MHSSTDRGRRIGRHVILWLAGPIVLLVRDGLTALAAPNRCPAALDLIAIAIVREWPGLPIGQLLAWFHALVVVLALGCVVEWLHRLTGNAAVALAAGVTLGLSPALAMEFAPPTQLAAIGLCATIALAARYTGEHGSTMRSAALLMTTLLVAGLTVPSWFAPCALATLALAWRQQTGRSGARFGIALALAATVGAAPFIMLRMSHVPSLSQGDPWFACAIPSVNAAAWLPNAGSQLSWIFGPIAVALAALGLWIAGARSGTVRFLVLGGLIALASVPASSARQDTTLAALVVAGWSAAVIGLDEIVGMMRRARGGWIGVAILLCALPALENLRVRSEERDDVVRPKSHERASLATVTSILNQVPSDARFVEEDASIDLLLRASVIGGRRATKPLVVISPVRANVARAIREGTVYAFPHAQEVLALRGFEVQSADGMSVRGLARIAGIRACQELGTSWSDLSAEGVHGRFAIVADSEASRGPVVLYFGGTSEYEPGPDAWPPRVRTGFQVRLFDRRTGAAAAVLEAEARELHLEGAPVFGMSFVSTMVVRRSARSPLELPVVLGPPRAAGIGRLREDAPPTDRIAVCDAPPATISTF